MMKTYKTKMRELAGEGAEDPGEEGEESDLEEGYGPAAGTGDSA